VPGVDTSATATMASGKKFCRYDEPTAVAECQRIAAQKKNELLEIWSGPVINDADRDLIRKAALAYTVNGATDWPAAYQSYTSEYRKIHGISTGSSFSTPQPTVTTTCKTRSSSFYGRYTGTSNSETTCTTH
jgi:hypothetical protein